ncbi:MAG TPA: hypothetical protein VGQ42_08965 [Candidatus Dormibacteraeota bacterium]|jgi:putative effector of murein hydrolase LrgA (UPF0299 family)|nr:hypothetical protein [Candidatus Dormibacteraeota bacterium]
MLSEVLVLVIGGFVALWVVAIVDLVRATEMEPIGRLILAAVLIFVAPIGVLVWIGVRGGRAGVLAVTAMTAVALAVAIGVAGGSHPSVQTESAGAGANMSVPAPVPQQPNGP